MFTMGCLVDCYDGSYVLQDLNGKIKLDVRTAAPTLEGGGYLLPSMFVIAEGELDEVSMRFTVKRFLLPRYDSAIGASRSARLNDYRTKMRVIMGELLKYNSN
jgi:hypothetical protein